MHEKNLEQTTAQIAQLEQQIYSIEAANINQETLNAMKAAGAAMTQIHGSMTIDKVDETMYVLSLFIPGKSERKKVALYADNTGINSANNTNSARKSHRPSRTTRWANSPTIWNWRRNSRVWSRRLWTSACSRLAQCPLRISADYPPRATESVSVPCPFFIQAQAKLTNNRSRSQNKADGRR